MKIIDHSVFYIHITFSKRDKRDRPMTDFIDTYLLNHGMPKQELCAIKRRRFYYYGIAGFGALAVTFLTLTALGITPPL